MHSIMIPEIPRRESTYKKILWEPLAIIAQYGSYESYELPSGDSLLALPSRSVPIEYLQQETWRIKTPMGNARRVYSVDELADGTKPHIIIKSPERIFTKNEKILSQGNPWWGGLRSGESRTITIKGNPVVEEQIFWEAITLMELLRLNIRAEIPQAIISHADGSNELVVQEFMSWSSEGEDDGFPQTHSKESVTESGLVPEDYTEFNILRDNFNRQCIIDVNRWSWPPYTNSIRQKLLTIAREAPEK